MKKKNNYSKVSLVLLMVLLILCTTVSCASKKEDYNSAQSIPEFMHLSDSSYVKNYIVQGEQYTSFTENPFIQTSENNKSYFSVHANTSSYPNLRSLLENNYPIPADAVRIEEMLNYFDYDYKTPEGSDILELNTSLFDNPFNKDTKILTIGLAAKEAEFKEMKNNIVFLIDTSGSMYDHDKLPLVQESFKMLTENLNPTDRVSVVTYAGGSGVVLEGAFGKDKEKITAVIQDLQASGSTYGSEGIQTAYEIAKEYFIKGGNNRVILATDGDFNVGISDIDELKEFISDKRKSGIYFSVFGVGRGNLNSEIMETLANNGNGTFSYIDSVNEAKRALVEQIGGSMITVAKDVKSGIEFNSDVVESYRLIGYENNLLTEDEFNDNETDAGEIGSGHTVTVAYEITLKENKIIENGDYAKVIIKYKPTENVGGDEIEKELTLDVNHSAYHPNLTENDLFVSSVIEFGLILRDSEYKADANLSELKERLDKLSMDNDNYKQEFIKLVKNFDR